MQISLWVESLMRGKLCPTRKFLLRKKEETDPKDDWYRISTISATLSARSFPEEDVEITLAVVTSGIF